MSEDTPSRRAAVARSGPRAARERSPRGSAREGTPRGAPPDGADERAGHEAHGDRGLVDDARRGGQGLVSSEELTRAVKTRALELGFARVGVARAEPLEPEGAQLRAFIAAGRHGQMGWLADTAEVRADPSRMVDGACAVLVVALPYARTDAGPAGPPPARIARYARGRDYHNVIRRRLRKLERWLRDRGHDARWSVDARPVLERAWAARAGVGFVGKNCCVIVPGLGSHVFLGAVITSAPLVADAPMAPRCGACTRCLDACPTRAFVGANELDARRCISYLTIEHAGAIDTSLREGVGDWLFGCDTCQDVCPFNASLDVDRLPRAVDPALTDPFAPDPRHALALEALLGHDDEGHAAWAEGTPLRRAGRARLARNASIVLGNAGSKRHLPVLERVAATDDDHGVRDAARWAAERLRSR